MFQLNQPNQITKENRFIITNRALLLKKPNTKPFLNLIPPLSLVIVSIVITFTLHHTALSPSPRNFLLFPEPATTQNQRPSCCCLHQPAQPLSLSFNRLQHLILRLYLCRRFRVTALPLRSPLSKSIAGPSIASTNSGDVSNFLRQHYRDNEKTTAPRPLFVMNEPQPLFQRHPFFAEPPPFSPGSTETHCQRELNRPLFLA
ncbi:hypothetical protein PIB30_071179 [Stylosanthes scabra]|uniref:Uncharacterized protein n=1 Tax=Stylosanthes scabra TaxID=79078 RepID=A0ABU6SQE2_9FABA|nr:hypothetical protein [Stylosanthes scabra]